MAKLVELRREYLDEESRFFNVVEINVFGSSGEKLRTCSLAFLEYCLSYIIYYSKTLLLHGLVARSLTLKDVLV